MPRHRIALVGLGMAITPHAKSLLDLQDRAEVACAISPTAARRAAFEAPARRLHGSRGAAGGGLCRDASGSLSRSGSASLAVGLDFARGMTGLRLDLATGERLPQRRDATFFNR